MRTPDRGAPAAPVIALATCFAIALFLPAAAIAHMLLPPTHLVLAAGFPTSERQNSETLAYALTVVAIVPAALALASRVADSIAAGPNEPALAPLAAGLAGTLAAAIVVAKLLPLSGIGVPVATVAVWSLGAGAGCARAMADRSWTRALRLAPHVQAVSVAAGILILAAVLAFVHLQSIDPVGLVVGVLVAAVAIVAAAAGSRLPAIRGGGGVAVDIGLAVVLILAIPQLDLFNLGPGDAGHPLPILFYPVLQFHQSFYLGPAGEVLHGEAMLVSTASQYGVMPIYVVAAWSKLAPIGYGTLTFGNALLFAAFFASGFAVLRIARVQRGLAAATLAIAVIVLVWNLDYPVGSLPQHGPLRFGLPMILIVTATAAARWPGLMSAGRLTQALVLGLSAVWSGEAFGYTLVTFAALAWIELRLGGEGRPRLARIALGGVVACIATHLMFAGATWAASGELPDWGRYGAFLHTFLLGDLGHLTYDFSPWSPGFAVGAAYLVAAVALVVVVRRSAGLVAREPAAFTALTGTTAFGVALFSYFVDRSLVEILPYVSLPAMIAAALWLSLILREVPLSGRIARSGSLALAAGVAALLVSIAWPSIGPELRQSALAHVIPGGESMGTAMTRLWHPPPLNPATAEGQKLVARYFPGRAPVPIMVSPELETEILMRSDRTSAFGFGYAREDSFAPDQRLPALTDALERLRPGDRLLLQQAGLDALRGRGPEANADPLANPGAAVFVGGPLAGLQVWALQWIRDRYGVRVVRRDDDYVLVELEPAR